MVGYEECMYEDILRYIKTDNHINNLEELIHISKDMYMKYSGDKKLYCLLFYVEVERNDRYNMATILIENLLENKDDFIHFYKDKYLKSIVLNKILKISTTMKIKLKDVITVVYEYIFRIKDINMFIEQLIYSLNNLNDSELNNKFNKLLKDCVDEMAENIKLIKLEDLLKKISNRNNNIFETVYIEDVLIYTYFKSLNKEKGLTNINILQSIITLAKMDGRDRIKIKEEALRELQENIEKVDLRNVSKIDYSNSKFSSLIEQNKQFRKEYFESTSIKTIISNIGKGIGHKYRILKAIEQKQLIYYPVPIKVHREFENVFLLLTKSIVIDDKKVVSNKDIQEYLIENIEYYSHLNFYVLPYMEWIYINNIIALKEIRLIFKKSKFYDEELYKYYLKIEKYFSYQYCFEFINLGVILIEKILRKIYKNELGRSIIEKNNNPDVQLEVTLGQILNCKRVKECIGSKLCEYIDYCLNNENGRNIRNRCMHGLMNMEEYSEIYMYIVMHIILILITIDN